MGFGPKWQEIGLPHPVPIACVGCGDCDAVLLQLIAKITNGMYAIVDNVEELSTFFRRQVRFIPDGEMGHLYDCNVMHSICSNKKIIS